MHTEYNAARTLCEQGHLQAAFALLRQSPSHFPPGALLCSLLQQCHFKKDLFIARQAHALILRYGCEPNFVLKNCLIRMFSACGSLAEANQVFLSASSLDVYSWEAIFSAHVNCGQHKLAIELYHKFRSLSTVKPNDHIYVAVARACAGAGIVSQGMVIHDHILHSNMCISLYIGSALLDMYAKCGYIHEVCIRRVFLPTRSHLPASSKHVAVQKPLKRDLYERGVQSSPLFLVCKNKLKMASFFLDPLSLRRKNMRQGKTRGEMVHECPKYSSCAENHM